MRKCFLFSIFLFILSCSTVEDPVEISQNNQIVGYKNMVESHSINLSNPINCKTETIGVVQGGKLHQVYEDFYLNNMLQSHKVLSNYVYESGNLISTELINPDNLESDVRNFNYDNQNRIISGERINSNSIIYYRFVYPNANTVYSERLTLPYDNPDAAIVKRVIGVFNGNKLVNAGFDSNLDGVIENQISYSYNGEDISSVSVNSQTIMLEYSNIKNTMNILYDDTFGYKNRRIICLETFCGSQISDFFIENLYKYTKHLSLNEINGFTYETLPNNLYNKKSKSENVYTPYEALLNNVFEFYFE